MKALSSIYFVPVRWIATVVILIVASILACLDSLRS